MRKGSAVPVQHQGQRIVDQTQQHAKQVAKTVNENPFTDGAWVYVNEGAGTHIMQHKLGRVPVGTLQAMPTDWAAGARWEVGQVTESTIAIVITGGTVAVAIWVF